MAKLHRTALPLLMLCTLSASPLAHASSALAVDNGCYSCHSGAPNASAPSFERLAAKFAKNRTEAGAEDELVNELRKPKLFGRIAPHERLTEANARALARWILDGAR